MYWWDETGEKINSASQNLVIGPQKSVIFSFTTPRSLKAGTYMLKSTLSLGDYKNISKIRFSLPGVAPRIYYSGFTQENDRSTYFACIGNVTDIADPNNKDLRTGKINLTLSNSTNHKKIDELSSSGELFPAFYPSLYKKQINSSLTGNLALKTEVFDKNGNLYQSKEIPLNLGGKPIGEKAFNFYLLISVILFVGLGIIGLFLSFKKKKKILGLIIILIGLLILLLGIFLPHQNVKAKHNDFLPSSWSGEFNRFKVKKGWWGVEYANLSIDFHIPSSLSVQNEGGKIIVEPGTAFDIIEDNYGSYYITYGSYDSPFFVFKDRMYGSVGTENDADYANKINQEKQYIDQIKKIVNDLKLNVASLKDRIDVYFENASSTIASSTMSSIQPLKNLFDSYIDNAIGYFNGATKLSSLADLAEVSSKVNSGFYELDYALDTLEKITEQLPDISTEEIISTLLEKVQSQSASLSDLISALVEEGGISYAYNDSLGVSDSSIQCSSTDYDIWRCSVDANAQPKDVNLTLKRTIHFPSYNQTAYDVAPAFDVTIGKTKTITIKPAFSIKVSDKDVNEGDSVKFDDAQIINESGKELSLKYLWNCSPSTGSLDDPTILNPTFFAPKDVEGDQTYTCTLKVTNLDEGYDVSKSLKVTVHDLAQFSISPRTTDINVGQKKQFTAFFDCDGPNSYCDQKDVTDLADWSVSDPSIISVDNDASAYLNKNPLAYLQSFIQKVFAQSYKKGMVTAKKPGTAYVIAKYKGKTASSKVTVKKISTNIHETNP